METKIIITIIIAVFIVYFLIGRYTTPTAAPSQISADSTFDAQWAAYEKDIADDTTYCTLNGKTIRCANVPTLGGFIDWKEKNGYYKK
jgi:hypothetical protein